MNRIAITGPPRIGKTTVCKNIMDLLDCKIGGMMQTEIIQEGSTKIVVPVLEKRANYPPSSASVFYNPTMELNRDISVACIGAFARKQDTYIDALGATGIRGVRMANEVGLKVVINDWNPRAYELIRRNIEQNQLNARAQNKNANVLLSESHFDIVDVDPFGTPMPFLDSACRSVKKMLCITATDTAPLCGAHKASGIRKYGATPLNTEYHSEMGVRILLGAIARNLARYDKSMSPLLSYAMKHYVRVYLAVEKGAAKSNEMMGEVGFICHCFGCGFRSWKHGLTVSMCHSSKNCESCSLEGTSTPEKCPSCADAISLAGPLWLGRLHDKKFCDLVLRELEHRKLGTRQTAIKLVRLCAEEQEIPTYYDQHMICKKLKINPPSIEMMISALCGAGFQASRTHFSGTSFKTDAPLEEIEKILCR
ncbi:MAG: tRNA (guanine(10)-N(2))-dimethyltransferase [Methanocellales archaeon]|nr:tRNA (guanine(10)-N(2))-dimethyltransferase [Methanocellales archaeon]